MTVRISMMLSSANMLPIFAALASKVPIIAHSHLSATPKGILRKALHAVNVRILRRLPVQKYACGIRAGIWMWGRGFNKDNVIPNAIDFEKFRFQPDVRKCLRERYAFGNRKAIGFVGRFDYRHKIDALEELLKISPDYKLVTVGGNGQYEGFLQRIAEKNLQEFYHSEGEFQPMIRVLHIVPTVGVNNGMMSVIMSYYRAFDKSAVQFDFLYFEETEVTHKDEITTMGGRVFFFPLRSFSPIVQIRLRRFFQAHAQEWAVVHCHPLWTPFVVAPVAKRCGIKRIIAHSHSTVSSDKKLSALRNNFLLRFIRFFATDFAACSTDAAKLFGKISDTPGRVRIVTNAIEWNRYAFSPSARQKTRRELGIDENALLLGHTGRLSAEKNQLFLIDVIAAMRRRHPEIKCAIVGEGTMREQLARRIADYGLNNVCILLGERADVPDLLSAMDMFFLPSIFEGVPLSAVEALASGLPCVLSDAITRDLDSEHTLYLPLSKGAEYWAEAARSFWESAGDCRKEGNLSCESVEERYNIRSQSKALEAYYLSLSEK